MALRMLDMMPEEWKMEFDVRFGALTASRKDARELVNSISQELERIIESMPGVEIEISEQRTFASELADDEARDA